MESFTPKFESREIEPKIRVRIPTKNDEIKRIKYTLEKISWYKEHNLYPHNTVLPKYFSDLAEELLSGRLAISIEEDEINNNLEYSPEDYLEIYEFLNKEIIPKTKEIMAIFRKWESDWGFKCFEEYSILLTKYGTGGSYHEDTGIIKVRMDDSRNYFEAAIHELIHIGIERLIIEKFNLSQQEKERVVDLIYTNILKLPGRVMQNENDDKNLARLNEFITEEYINDLPSAIEKYKQSKK
ncbi:MAG TPA: hypothetical protein DIC35_03605 [Candidatus Moranbacteria bacterium]|nr:hypothetical protein [Candidatus Moranbacteria bacterium]